MLNMTKLAKNLTKTNIKIVTKLSNKMQQGQEAETGFKSPTTQLVNEYSTI